MSFSSEEIHKLNQRKSKLEAKWIKVQTTYLNCLLSDELARENLYHGFLRRLGTVVRCIQNTFAICPPDQDRKLSREEEIDLRIQLQTHILNAFGCLDNLAWIWVLERKVTDNGKEIRRGKVGFSKKCDRVRNSLPSDVLEVLKNQTRWLEDITNVRDALSHRIPIYVPPYFLTQEEGLTWKALEVQMLTALARENLEDVNRFEKARDALGQFRPIMMHSDEKGTSAIAFHAKILQDFEVITELADKLLAAFFASGEAVIQYNR
jgi:hypothetical protein